MADNLDDGEFWLPAQFLTDTDDDTVGDSDISSPTANSTNGFNSDLGSPVESVTETESDEDDFLDELTLQMTRHFLLQDSGATVTPKALSSSGSPQSILSPVPVSPPPAPAKVEKLKVGDEGAKLTMRTEQPSKGTGYFDSKRGITCPPIKPTPNPNFHGGFPPQSDLSHQQLQAYQFQQLWNQQQSKIGGATWNHNNRPLGLSQSAWPPLQHPSNRRPSHPPPPTTGMRAVYLGSPGPKRESTGTGVFLPRRITPTEPRKNNPKSGGSTALVPEKVVQALNINKRQLDSTGKSKGYNNGVQVPKRNNENACSQSSTSNPEIQLPSEWTY